MNPEDKERLDACITEVAEILYRNSSSSDLQQDFEHLEQTIRQKILLHVSPKIALFFIQKITETNRGRKRQIKTTVGSIYLRGQQGKKLGIAPYKIISPFLQKCCLLISANNSYIDGEKALEFLTGLKKSDTTLQRQVNSEEFEVTEINKKIKEVSIDGGKVRIRSGQKGVSCYFRDYKAARVNSHYYGAFFQDNISLTDCINSQDSEKIITCIGDGHEGIWNLFKEISVESKRREILDWYHLVENLYKVGGSLKRLSKAKNMLWVGKTEEASKLFVGLKGKNAANFPAYLEKHKQRIVNYKLLQEKGLCSIGSGAVESAIKQISARIKISGAQWNAENVNQILQLRCWYLNEQLAS
ncbi:MAG: ISKra4 family transposase [Oscillatoria sp. SIO1A7]|nr:ISKra4 family transposase [Oscillatoria sp. SIO1A7]